MNATENVVAPCRCHHLGGTWYTFLWNDQAYLQNCTASRFRKRKLSL